MAYLDHAATTNMLPEVKQLLVEQLGAAHNPSSIHQAGRAARQLLEESRERISSAIKVKPAEIYFTSGGTESDNTAIKGIHWARNRTSARKKILVPGTEHHAVLDPANWLAARGEAELIQIPVDQFGRIDLDWLTKTIEADKDAISLISVMWANNEVGTVQPVEAVQRLAEKFDIPVHTDAVQALGSLPIDLSKLNIAALSASGHKIGAMHGTGFLMLRSGMKVDPVLHGGNQERDVRSGTINVLGAQALALAVELAVVRQQAHTKKLTELRDQLVARVKQVVPDAIYNGDPVNRLPGNAHFSFYGAEGDVLLMLLDESGIQVSTGAACSVGIPQASHVLIAMGLDPIKARSSIRFSLGSNTTTADIDKLIAVLPDVVERARVAGMVSANKVSN